MTFKERSIHYEYLQAIANAKHFLYIENQFFISSLAGEDLVQNQIAAAIARRVAAAIKGHEAFRVVIVLPQHPEGSYLESATVRYLMHFQYLTICRGDSCLMNAIKRECPQGVDLSEYVSFYCLANWGVLNEKLVREQVYVHSKVRTEYRTSRSMRSTMV